MKTSIVLKNTMKTTLDKYLALYLFISTELILFFVLFFPRLIYKLFKIEVLDIFIDYGVMLAILFLANTFIIFLLCINYFNNTLSRWKEHYDSINTIKYNIKNLSGFEKQILREFYISQRRVVEVPRKLYVIDNLVDKSLLEFVPHKHTNVTNVKYNLVKLSHDATKYISLADLDWPVNANQSLSVKQRDWLNHNRPNWVIK